MSLASALYIGAVTHRRKRPRVHGLRSRVFWMLLDLDEIDTLAERLRLFSRNRFNALSFHDRDHGAGTGEPLRDQVERHLASAGLETGGAIRLFCMPRVLGYVFNPLSIYFCHRRDGELQALIYQVHNTFKERHSYLIPAAARDGQALTQQCAKRFHVSPFLDMDMTYEFRVTGPHERIAVVIHGADRDGPIITAALAGTRAPITDAGLIALLVSHPLLTLKVIAAIHWHAVKLWWKGIKIRTHPAAPVWPVTIVNAQDGRAT